MIKILCFGDSITSGESDHMYGGWADRLKIDFFNQFMQCRLQGITLFNLGIGGETTDGLGYRFETELDARIIKGQRTIVVFAYGANDIVIHKDKNIVPESYFVRNLTYSIKIAKAANAEILLLSMLPISDKIDGKINQHEKLRYSRDILRYNDIIEKLSIDFDCEYLDIHSAFLENNKEQLLSDDGVHPNAEGHDLLYRAIKEKFNKLSI